MWIKKLKKQKIQFTLIGITLVVITMIFVGCIGFMLQLKKNEEKYFGAESAPDLQIYLLGAEDVPRESIDKTGKTSRYHVLLGKAGGDGYTINQERQIAVSTVIMAIQSEDDIYWDFETEGFSEEEKYLEEREVLISKVWADLNDIKIGDSIVFLKTNIELIVKGFYKTSTVPATTIGLAPVYINAETMKHFDTSADMTLLSMNFKENDKDIAKTFIKEMPNEIRARSNVQIEKSAFITSYTMLSVLLGSVSIIASVLIFVAALLVIRFMVRNNLEKEYKTIGIYKAVGFQEREIRTFYQKGYLLIGGVSIAIGAALGMVIEMIIGKQSVYYLGNYEIGQRSVVIAALGVCFLFGILYISMAVTLKRLKKINPVQAIQAGQHSSKGKLTKSLIPNAGTPFATAVNGIVKNKKATGMLIGVLALSFYLIFIFTAIMDTCQNILQNEDIWFQIPNTSYVIQTEITDELRQYLDKNEYIDSIVYLHTGLFISPESKEMEISGMSIMVMSEFEGDYYDGRGPKRRNEIAISKSIAKRERIRTGDYFRIEINTVEEDYLVVGIYGTMMQGGEQMQVTEAALDAANISWEYMLGAFELEEESAYQEFLEDLNQKFPEIEVYEEAPTLVDTMKSIEDIITPVSYIMIVIFSLFSILSIVNILIMHTVDSKRKFTIMKALGFTDSYILRQTIWYIQILTMIAIGIAAVMQWKVSPILFEAMIKVDAMKTPWGILLGISGSLMILISGLICLLHRRVRKLSPVELMEE